MGSSTLVQGRHGVLAISVFPSDLVFVPGGPVFFMASLASFSTLLEFLMAKTKLYAYKLKLIPDFFQPRKALDSEPIKFT